MPQRFVDDLEGEVVDEKVHEGGFGEDIFSADLYCEDALLPNIGEHRVRRVAGTYLITKMMATTAAAHSAFERFMYNLFTPLFADIYLKEYLKLSGYSKKEIKLWIPIRAATYLDFDIPQSANKKLHKIVKKALRKRASS